jgi:cytochrome c
MKKVVGVVVLGVSLFGASGGDVFKKCVSCHGSDGKNKAISGKIIAKQKESDLIKKLTGYKKGSFGGAKKGMMTNVLKPLSDTDIKAVATYVSKLK